MRIEPNFTSKQDEAMTLLLDQNNGVTEVLYGGSAGSGKSYLAVAWLIIVCISYPGTRWLMGRAVLKSLKETTLNSFFDVCKQWGIRKDKHWVYNTKDNIITFSKELGGSQILLKDLYLYPSDPEFDSLGSLEISGAIIDEVSQISKKAKDIVMSRIRYKLDDYGLIPKMLLATNPAKNWSYTEFYKPYKAGRLASHRAFVPALPDDNEYLSKHYKENLKRLDEASKQRLLLGNWEYDDNIATLIGYDRIESVFTNEVLPGKWYISADIARQGRDQTVIGLWSGMRLEKIFTMKRNKVTEAASKILQIRKEFGVPARNICVDSDGIGAGVLDLLGDDIRGIVNNSAPVRTKILKENFGNLKSQLYFYLAEAINRGDIHVRCDLQTKDKIIRELEVVRQREIDKDGKWWLIKKDEVKDLIGRSPDYSDMMAYRMIFEIEDRGQWI